MKFRFKFYSKKTVVLAAIAVIALYIVPVTVFYIYDRGAPARLEKALQIEKQAALDQLSAEEKAIVKAEAYLSEQVVQIESNERLFLAYLQRKFDLNKRLSAEGTPIDLYENPRTYPEEVHFLARIAFPDRLVTAEPTEDFEDGKILNVYSANCDRLSLPLNYWSILRRNIEQGGYYLTHAALAFAFMKDNNCELSTDADSLKRQVTEGMVRVANEAETEPDLFYEAVAFLLLNGELNMVDSAWISKIVSLQREDGSWSIQLNDSKGSTHSTILALWALLEYENPNKPYESLIPRPTGGS